MKAIKLGFIGMVVIVVLAACNTESVQPTLTPQDFGTASDDRARDVAAPKGGVGAVVVGDTNGALNGPNLGSFDAFIRRYDNGVGWASQFGTRSTDFATNVAVTSTGISYVVGQTSGALRFKVGGYDVYLRKYDARGVLQWTRQFGTIWDDYPIDVTLDSSGNVYVLSQEDEVNFRIRKFNTSGTLLQTITNTTSFVTPTALGIDSTGNIFVLTQYFESPNRWGRIFKYSSAGTLLISPIVSGTNISPDEGNIVVDSSDNVTYSVFNNENNSNGGGFVIRMNNTLTTYLWIKSIEPATTGQVSRPRALALDSKNNVYVTGYTTGAYPGFTNAGARDIFVLKLASATGNRLWTQQFGGNDSDVGTGIALSDAVYVAGYSDSNPNLLGDPNYCNCFGADAFLAQLSFGTGAILGIDQ